MKRIVTLAVGIAALTIGGAAAAHHLQNLNTPYDSRGQCESAVAQFNQDDWDVLLAAWPDYFADQGEVASFLTRAFPCEQSGDSWYIRNRYGQVLNSDWYQRHH